MAQMAQVAQLVKTVKSASNPSAMLNSMLQSNPQVNNIIRQYGGDAQKAFYAVAKQNGIDPTDILNMLK